MGSIETVILRWWGSETLKFAIESQRSRADAQSVIFAIFLAVQWKFDPYQYSKHPHVRT